MTKAGHPSVRQSEVGATTKEVGEIGCMATAGAVADALYSYDGIGHFHLPMQDAPVAAPSAPKSRKNASVASK